MMAGDDKKTKADLAPKAQPPVKDKSAPSAPGADLSKAKGGETAATPSKAKDGEAAATPSKAKDDSEIAATPSSGYSRGEGQKPVSQAYKDNWNAIFAKKKKKR